MTYCNSGRSAQQQDGTDVKATIDAPEVLHSQSTDQVMFVNEVSTAVHNAHHQLFFWITFANREMIISTFSVATPRLNGNFLSCNESCNDCTCGSMNMAMSHCFTLMCCMGLDHSWTALSMAFSHVAQTHLHGSQCGMHEGWDKI